MLPVVLIHGWASTPEIWQPFIAQLPQHECINLALPAYNNKGNWQQPAEYMLEQLPSRCHIVGWSLGGNVAMAMAAKAPANIASVATIASVPNFVASDAWPWAMALPDFEQFTTGLKAAPALTLKRFAGLQAKGSKNERDLVKTLRRLVLNEPLAALEDSLQWLGETAQYDLWQSLPQPSLHLFGGGDALVPEAAVKHCSNAKLIAAAGHAPMLSQPRLLADQLQQFWSGVA